MSTALYLGGNVECNYNTFKNFKVDLGTSMYDYGQNGQIRTINGSLCFYYNGWHVLGDTTLPIPANTVFVSPNFTNVSPFYSDITSAVSNSNNGDYIIVFPGAYTGNYDLSKRHWYFHSNTQLIGNNDVYYDSDTSIRGGCVFNGNASGYALNVVFDGPANVGHHILEFDLACEGDLILNRWCGIVRCNLCSSISVSGGAYDSYYKDIFIHIAEITDFTIGSAGNVVYVNADTIVGNINIVAGDTIIEFKRITGVNATGNIVTVAGNGATKPAKLKLIDGAFPEDWNAAPPILIGDYGYVDLQHVWIKNAHSEAIRLDGSIRNSHLLKVDNCILIANQAIDATISGQDVYCFGSWGANDVTSNIVMRTEPLNIGAIW